MRGGIEMNEGEEKKGRERANEEEAVRVPNRSRSDPTLFLG